MVELEEVILDCNPVFKEREEMVCILPTQMMLGDAERHCLSVIKKKFAKELYLPC